MYIKFLNQNSPQIGIKCIFATATIDLCQRLGHLVVFFDIVIELTPPPPSPWTMIGVKMCRPSSAFK